MLNLRRTIYQKIDLGDRVRIINDCLIHYSEEGILTAIAMDKDEENPYIVLLYKDFNDHRTCFGQQRCRFEDMKKI
jgi:hypothetical protein